MKMKHGRRHVVLLFTDQNKSTLPKQDKVLLVMESIFGWPKSVLLHYTTLLSPESSLWTMQQFPRRSCQAETAVISGAQAEERKGTPLETARAYNSGKKRGFGSTA